MPPKLKATQKIVTTPDGKTRIVDDHAKMLKSKPAGQQFWNGKKRRYGKRASAANVNRTP